MQKQHSSKFVKLVTECKQQIKETDMMTVHQRLARHESFYLIDVREESEWQQGHLPTAIHLSKGIIERDIENVIPDTHTEILLYCGGGYRSALTAFNLQKMGYTHVTSIDGGFRQWLAQGFPVEVPEEA